jgi:hypothetical protein
MVKPLPIDQLYHSGWPHLVLDAVPVGVGDWCGWQGERFWRRVRGRNDGEFVNGREEGVLIAVVVGVNNGKMPVVGSTGAMPAFEDGGVSLVVGLDIMLGEEDDREVGVTEGGNANQGPGE